MGSVFSDLKGKKEYYKQQADELRMRARKVRAEIKDDIEANRLENLADQADNDADGIDQQLAELAEKV